MKSLMMCILLAGLVALGPLQAAVAGDTAVVVVDVQADFTQAHKGSLAVSGTDEAYLKKVAQATAALKEAGLPIYATQDWHPSNHMSFAANQPGKKPFELIDLPDGRKQVLWPVHCVQNSSGAKILLDKSLFTAVIQKGTDADYDSYSGFKDDGGAKTALDETLKGAGLKTLIMYGIATDYCVKATVLDGLAAGYKVVVVQDLCRGVAPDTSQAAWEEMKKKGAELWPSLDVDKAKSL